MKAYRVGRKQRKIKAWNYKKEKSNTNKKYNDNIYTACRGMIGARKID